MKQSALQRFDSRHSILLLPITLAVVLSGTAKTNSSACLVSLARNCERQETTQEAKPTDVRELKMHVPIERGLAGGEAHSYSVALTAGQYLHVVVEQKGIDVVVTLSGPDAQKIAEVDSPNGAQG